LPSGDKACAEDALEARWPAKICKISRRLSGRDALPMRASSLAGACDLRRHQRQTSTIAARDRLLCFASQSCIEGTNALRIKLRLSIAWMHCG
jgi:hypothetical protein